MSTDGSAPIEPGQTPAGPPQTPPPPPGQQPVGYEQPGAPAPIDPAQERSWAMIAHIIPIVASIVSAGTLGFVASLIVYLVFKDRGPFVRRFSANALNIQIMEFIVVLISIPLLFVLIGFITLPLAIILATIFHIIAAVKASNGEWYDPPLVPRFVK